MPKGPRGEKRPADVVSPDFDTSCLVSAEFVNHFNRRGLDFLKV